jgi:hypothetical protein
VQEQAALEERIGRLASSEDADLMRYAQWRAPVPPGLIWKLRWAAGQVLRMLGLWGGRHPESWPVRLKASAGTAHAEPLLLWAIGSDAKTIRRACSIVAVSTDLRPEFAPVLVTDVADFAFYSRTNWLVEFVPKLSGGGEDFAQRKARFLARLYRDAPVVGVDAIVARGAVPAALTVNRADPK